MSAPRPALPLVVLCAALYGAAAPQAARAQAAQIVSGDVVQAETGAPIGGATVVLLPATPGAVPAAAGGSAFLAGARRLVTAADGRYGFADVVPGAYVLRVQRLGFRPATVDIELRDGGVGSGGGGNSVGAAGARVSVGLTVVPIRLRPVAVAAAAPEPYARRARTAREVADARAAALRLRRACYLATDVREVTHADVVEAVTLGETDLFRALQRLPGVATRGDANAELWTRGARWDQTRVTFDGLPLFNPLHAGGALSAVSTDAIGAAFLLPGVRPAAVGEGGAAVLALRSRPGGGAGALRGAGELSLLSARAALDQTVAGGRGAWMLSARRSYLDLILPRLTSDSGHQKPFHLTELTARADWRFAGGQALAVSALRSADDAFNGTVNGSALGGTSRWSNTAARVTLTTPARLGWLGPVAVRHTLGVSAYAGDGDEGGNRVVRTTTPARDAAVTTSFLRPEQARVTYAALTGELLPSQASGAPPTWSAGYALSAQRTAAAGELRGLYTADTFDSTRTARDGTLPLFALWAERRVRPTPRLTVAAGLRVEAGAAVAGAGAVRPAPRVTARYAFGDSSTVLSAGLGRHVQYTQSLLGSPAAGTYGDDQVLLRTIPLWLAADHATPALRTDLATAGLERWTGAGWDWTVNAYLRRSTGVLIADEPPGPAVDRALFAVATARARGVEFGVRRVAGRWTGSANYAWSAATTAAFGLRYPSTEDQPHVFNATALWRATNRLRLGTAYAARSGVVFTRVGTVAGEWVAQGDGRWVWRQRSVFDAPNAERLGPYQRLDLLGEWAGAVGRVRTSVYLQVANALGRRNALGTRGVASGCTFAMSPYPTTCTPRYAADPGLIRFPLVGVRASF